MNACRPPGSGPRGPIHAAPASHLAKRRFLPNLQARLFWGESESRWVRLRVSGAALRLIDKNGIEAVLADLRSRGQA